jgi:replicative DNA helicase
MLSNLDFALMAKVIHTGDFGSLEKLQITEEYLPTPACQEVFRYIRETYHAPSTAGMVPSAVIIASRFPGFHILRNEDIPDSIPILAQELRKEYLKFRLQHLAGEINAKADLDPQAALAELKSGSANLSSIAEVNQDLTMAGAYNELLTRYELVQDSEGMLGIPYPWAPLNEETQGMQGGQFIVLYGRPKSMKSWIGIYMACHAYLYSRRRVLFYTREMPPIQIASRAASIITGVDYGKFKSGKLQPEMKAKVFTVLKELLDDETMTGANGVHQPAFAITSDRGAQHGGGIGWLMAKIKDFKPDLVVVDGMYLMKDDRSNQRTIDWKAIAHISQDLKLLAQQFEVPLIGITQANRNAQHAKGEDLTELAFSDSLGQDADAVFRVSKVDTMDEQTKTKVTKLYLTAPGLREGKFDGIVLNGNPGYDFSYQHTIVDHEEAEKAAAYEKKGSGHGHSSGPPGATGFKKPSFMDPKLPAFVGKK